MVCIFMTRLFFLTQNYTNNQTITATTTKNNHVIVYHYHYKLEGMQVFYPFYETFRIMNRNFSGFDAN